MDDITSILQDICAVIQDSSDAELVVQGFGDSRWPVDTRTDLLTVVEQLPASLATLRRDQSFVVDFYEQGIERSVHFSPETLFWRLACSSRTSWVPMADQCEMTKASLQEMFMQFAADFVSLSRNVAPGFVEHEWYVRWSASLNE